MLYFCVNQASFVKKDVAIFAQKYDVKVCDFYHTNKKYTPILFLKQFWFLLVNIWGTKIVVCQFAGYHSFMPTLVARLFNIPSLIVAGGMDCVSFPSLRYGNFHKQLLGAFTRMSFYLCTHISPVHESLLKRNDTYYGDDNFKQGILHYCPNIRAQIKTIYNGYDAAAWPKPHQNRKPNSFITVAATLDNPVRMILKGADMVFDVARLLPDYSFTVIGFMGNRKPDWPANVTVLPFTPADELARLFGEHEFYLQLSISEGFPNALSEAMLCGCIPIVSEVASMSFIVGDAGFVLTQRNVSMLKVLLEDAVRQDKVFLSKAVRNRIEQNFPISKRVKGLLDLTEEMLHPNKEKTA
ncbi:Glycosyl transferases group 1 [Flexibacter flexilis DSM 6793]|uniref:Glycosyl transferases group 1 n=2 Tax=Flexibacter flexilis TaxID=998 RepID=A0A1I1D9E1_9BACT|nr:Glycosyl transferases group 1 [Flexibacter flexilis DSM 6793]